MSGLVVDRGVVLLHSSAVAVSEERRGQGRVLKVFAAQGIMKKVRVVSTVDYYLVR
jgi:hypothetical protein